jgi:hypothetical protein
VQFVGLCHCFLLSFECDLFSNNKSSDGYDVRTALTFVTEKKRCQLLKAKAVPLHATKALGGRGGIAPTRSRPRH